jgi:hypothetical protein
VGKELKDKVNSDKVNGDKVGSPAAAGSEG